MELIFKLTDLAFFVAVLFVTSAALVTAVRCNALRGNAVGAWVLFLGCLIGVASSLGYLVLGFLPGDVIYGSGPELSYGIIIALAVINLVSTLVMVVGAALFRPFDAAAATAGGAQ